MEGNTLIQQAQGITHGAVCHLGNVAQSSVLHLYLLRVHQFLHAIRDGINGDSFKIISLAAGQDRNGDLVHLCGRQNKNNIRGRLFQRF